MSIVKELLNIDPDKWVRYEYKCPYCGRINIRYIKTRRIVCIGCGRPFYCY